jgi:hypothetical protein
VDDMTDREKDALELIGTFLRAHYHEVQWTIEGTTEVLRIWAPGDPYRRELSDGFRVLLGSPLAEGTLAKLVQDEANRLVYNDEEARAYLKEIYEDLHLDFEED